MEPEKDVIELMSKQDLSSMNEYDIFTLASKTYSWKNICLSKRNAIIRMIRGMKKSPLLVGAMADTLRRTNNGRI